MQRVLTAAVLIPIVLLAVFKAPFWLYAILIALVALLCAHEYLNIAAAHNLKPLRWLVYIGVALVLADFYLSVLTRVLRPASVAGWQRVQDPFFQYAVVLALVNL